MRIKLLNPEEMAIQEIRGGATQRQVATTWAFAIMQGDSMRRAADVALERWKPSGLERILNLAWKMVEAKLEEK